jgi:hypothetical protein
VFVGRLVSQPVSSRMARSAICAMGGRVPSGAVGAAEVGLKTSGFPGLAAWHGEGTFRAHGDVINREMTRSVETPQRRSKT